MSTHVGRLAAIVSTGMLLAPLVSGGSRKDTEKPGTGINFWSIEREVALGRQLSAELERQVKLLDEPILGEYVNRITQNLAREAAVPFPVSVRILDSPDLNAFTLPGGHIYLNSGMLRLTESEAELAFVLSHELGHAAARHATRAATREELVQIGSIPLVLLGGWAGAALRQVAGPASQLGYLKGSRLFESQADLLGLQYLNRTGYDPSAAIDMLERIEGAERKRAGAVERLYSSHPLTAARIASTQKRIGELASSQADYVVTTSEYEQMRARVVAVEESRKPADASGPTLFKPLPQ